MDPREQIQLDDITFDDVIGGDGIELSPTDDVGEIEASPEAEQEERIENEDRPEDEAGYDDQEDVEDERADDKESEEDDEEEDDSIISSVLDKLGYDVDTKYDDTTEGLVELTKDMASQMANEQMEDTLARFPLVKDHLQYVLAGGESQNFMTAHDPNMDYNKLSIAENDIRSQKAILGDYLSTKGHDKEFINEMLEDFEDTGKLYQKSDAARRALGNHQQAQRQEMIHQQKEQETQKHQELTEFWNGVADTIEESREFAGLRVTEKDKGAFFQYLSSPVNQEGHTQRDIDHEGADMDTKLAIDYLMYKGFDLDGIIDTKARSKSVRNLKDRIVANESSVKSARRASKRTRNVDLEDLDLSL